MCDLKVGDKVEVVSGDGAKAYERFVGQIGEVVSVNFPRFSTVPLIETSLIEGVEMLSYRFKKVGDREALRKELSNALDLIEKLGISPHRTSYNIYFLNNESKWFSKDALINKLYPPTKTPKQLEVERIEKEMRELADRLADLNEEV